jgi:nitroreductase
MIRRLLRNARAWLPRPGIPEWIRREHAAVVEGILRKAGPVQFDFCRYRLRRSAHRIEKGLAVAAAERRGVFGAGFIEDMVGDLATLNSDAAFVRTNGGEMAGVFRLLREYFQAVPEGGDARVDAARRTFAGLAAPAADAGDRGRPAPAEPGAIGIDLLGRWMSGRHSVRHFADRPVSRDVLDECLNVARLAPSSCNRQPFRYEILSTPEAIRGFREVSIGLNGFSSVLPCVILLVGELRAFEHPGDRHLPFVDGALSAMLLLQALHARGLGSCVVNWPDTGSYRDGAARLLRLAPDQFVVLSIVCGFAAESGVAVLDSPRKPLDSLRHYLT